MTTNQELLARIQAMTAVTLAAPRACDSQKAAMEALREAIDDGRARLRALEREGQAGTDDHARLSDQVERWHFAWRQNR